MNCNVCNLGIEFNHDMCKSIARSHYRMKKGSYFK